MYDYMPRQNNNACSYSLRFLYFWNIFLKKNNIVNNGDIIKWHIRQPKSNSKPIKNKVKPKANLEPIYHIVPLTAEIMVVTNEMECHAAMSRLLSYAPKVVGFDMEWKRNSQRVALMQIAVDHTFIILIRVYMLKNIQNSLIDLLKNIDIIKCG
eukprot:476196_1